MDLAVLRVQDDDVAVERAPELPGAAEFGILEVREGAGGGDREVALGLVAVLVDEEEADRGVRVGGVELGLEGDEVT